MTVEISRTVAEAIAADVLASPRREICGLLFGTPERIACHQACRNVATSPADSFEIDPAALIAAYRAERGGGPRIVGCYHSHPSGAPYPSPRDAAAAAPNGWLWVIFAGQTLGCFRAVEHGPINGRFDQLPYRIAAR